MAAHRDEDQHPVRRMRLLITGAAGNIGRVLRSACARQYALVRLADRAPQEDAGPGEEYLQIDFGDLDATTVACEGIDCVVHLAGIPNEPFDNAWAQILPANKVKCITHYMGGGFGSKFGPDIQGLVAAELARKAGAAVKLMLDRAEEITVAGNRPSAFGKVICLTAP